MILVRKMTTVVKARDPSSVLALETMRARKYLPYRTSMGFWAVNNTRHIQSKYHQQYKAYPDNKKLDPRSISQLLNREKKWMEMIRQWDLNMQKNYKKVRSRCRKGIPRKIRPLAWHYLCGGQLLMGKPDTGCYAEFLSREGDPKYLADIQKDIDRQFFHEMFLSRETSSTTGGEEDKPPPGKQALVNILKAYSVVNPVVGYCQAQAPIAAFLLMHMPEEHAFWCLFSICDKYLRGYYSPGMEMIQLDGDILFNLLKKVSPHIHKLLTKQQVDPIMYMTEWFLCAFVRTLPWETLLRVWDMFLCEGVKIFFKAALVVIRMSLPCKTYAKLKKEFPTMYETLQALRHPSQQLLEEEIVVEQILNLNLTVEDFQHEHQRQTLKRKKKQQLKQNAASQHKTQGTNNVEPPR
uniref:TBC1 domain family member 10B n=1 Tax=Cacopsylla melanoneura TaxID=428564 RepID=A0A8D8RJ63_9HEMI